jgi:hypothetical protein
MQKGDEMSFVNQPKPRFLFNPSGSLKVIGTYINSFYLQSLRNVPWLGVGYNTGEICDLILKNSESISDSVPITWDGSNHDGHQYREIIEGIDGYLFKKTFSHVLPHLTSLPSGLRKQYYRILTMPDSKFYISHKVGNKYIKTVTGTIKGTTFSGHPTRTTLGNSLRVYLYSRYISHISQIPIAPLVAGDDVICFVSRKNITRFKRHFDRVYIDGEKYTAKDPVTHGLGQLSKDFKVQYDQKIDFLSKYGIIYNRTVVLNRRIERALLSGNHTNKLSKNFTPSLHRWSITTGLESWGYSWPIVKDIINLRKKLLAHWTPKRLTKKQEDVLNLQQSYIKHDNHYDYTNYGTAFDLMYNIHAINLMTGDLLYAPRYFDILYKQPPLKNDSTKKE